MQLDFATDKIYFLNPDSPADEDLGKAFPLVIFEGNASTRGFFLAKAMNVSVSTQVATLTECCGLNFSVRN
jgi:hypothetical protein